MHDIITVGNITKNIYNYRCNGVCTASYCAHYNRHLFQYENDLIYAIYTPIRHHFPNPTNQGF